MGLRLICRSLRFVLMRDLPGHADTRKFAFEKPDRFFPKKCTIACSGEFCVITRRGDHVSFAGIFRSLLNSCNRPRMSEHRLAKTSQSIKTGKRPDTMLRVLVTDMAVGACRKIDQYIRRNWSNGMNSRDKIIESLRGNLCPWCKYCRLKF